MLNRLWLILSFFVLSLLMGMNSVYPIPIKCRSNAHQPTIDDTSIIQLFGHLSHVGVDYKVKVGTNVYSVMDGIVIRTEDNGRVYGRYIMVLQCDGYLSLYAHLSAFKAEFGDVVRSGQLIALSGGDPNDDINGDGWSSGAHLHWEVRTPGHFGNNLYNLDPLKYLEMASKYIHPPKFGF